MISHLIIIYYNIIFRNCQIFLLIFLLCIRALKLLQYRNRTDNFSVEGKCLDLLTNRKKELLRVPYLVDDGLAVSPLPLSIEE